MLIFDLDGTVIDSKADITFCVNRTLEDMGMAAQDAKEIEKWIGIGVRPLFSRIFLDDEKRLAEALRLFDGFYKVHACDQTRLYDGISEVLEFFSGVPKVILSNKLQCYIDLIVNKLEIKNYFLSCYGREAFEKCKPDPMPVLSIVSKFSSSLDSTWIIGDTSLDIRAGKAAGVKTCAVLYGYSDRDPLIKEAADKYVTLPRELMELTL